MGRAAFGVMDDWNFGKERVTVTHIWRYEAILLKFHNFKTNKTRYQAEKKNKGLSTTKVKATKWMLTDF